MIFKCNKYILLVSNFFLLTFKTYTIDNFITNIYSEALDFIINNENANPDIMILKIY